MSGFTSRLRHVLAVGLIAGGCATFSFFVAPAKTQANVWLAHKFESHADSYVRSIALDSSTRHPSLLVNFTNAGKVVHIQPGNGYVPVNGNGYIAVKETLVMRDSPYAMELKARPNGRLLGFHAYENKVMTTNTLGTYVNWDTILPKGGRLLSNDLSVQFCATTIAVNGQGDIFVGGYRSENIVSNQENSDSSSDSSSDSLESSSSSSESVTSAKPKTYFVYQLFQDNLDAWHAQLLAFGATPPQLVSSASKQIILVSAPHENFQLVENGKSKLRLRTAGPLPEGNKPLTFDGVRSRTDAFHDSDDSIVLADNINSRVWRFPADGSPAIAVTGGDGPRDKRQTNPALFNFCPGPIAPAPDGGFFVADIAGKAILFIGPEDKFELRLATLVKEAEQLLRFGNRKDDLDQARIKVKVLEQLANIMNSDSSADKLTPMARVRARMALNTLRERIGTDWFSRLQQKEPSHLAAVTALPLATQIAPSPAAHTSSAGVYCPCAACSPSPPAPSPLVFLSTYATAEDLAKAKGPVITSTNNNWGEFNSRRSDSGNQPRHRGPAGTTKVQPPENKQKKKCCSCMGKSQD